MMTIGMLRDMLNDMIIAHGEDVPVVVKGGNSIYAEAVYDCTDEYGIRSFFGDDYRAVVIGCGGQVGAVWEVGNFDGDMNF